MDYLENYNQIIDYRKQNPLPKTEYGEVHHIKPKSIFPELAKDKNNKIRLTAYEHFMAHYYLMKYYEQTGEMPFYAKMLCAVSMMSKQCAEHFSDEEAEKLGSIYEEIKIKLSKFTSQRFKGIPKSEDQKNKTSNTLKGHLVLPETREKLSISQKGRPSPNKGKHLTPEQIAKMSAARKGRPSPNKGKHLTPEQIAKMSAARKGVKRKPLSLEHRKKISESLKGHAVSDECRKKSSISHKGKSPGNKGKKTPIEVRKKQSEARKRYYVSHVPWNTNKPCSPETRAKISAAKKRYYASHVPWNKGKLWSPETIAKMSASHKHKKDSIKNEMESTQTYVQGTLF